MPNHDRSPAAGDVVLRYVTAAGSALLGASAPCSTVVPGLQGLAGGYGLHVKVDASPGAVLAVDEDTGRSSLATAGAGSLRFDQTQRLFDLISRSRQGSVWAQQGLQELRAIETMPPTIPAAWRFVGYCLIAVGLCLRQNPGVPELAATAAMSLPMACLLLSMPMLGTIGPFVPGIAAFLVGLPVSWLVEHRWLTEPAHVVVPLLAFFIPGLLLAIGSLELVQGALHAGAARLVGGVFQLTLLAFGLVASEAAFALDSSPHPIAATGHIGTWSPAVGVSVYALGLWLAFCAPLSALPALTIVIFVAWGIQQLSATVTGTYGSTFLGAAVAVVVAQGIHTWFGPPPLLTLNPLFRILIPGGLSLLRVTSLTSGNFVGASLGVVVFTFIAVAMGLTVGMAAAERFGLRSAPASPPA
jgi:uncharacterized membrane protein YjjP (DUF1212 family)